jgi:dTDP-4-amino-4,6-dideoxygalactose transaminase
MAVFSFHPVKNITTGEGGMITTNDQKLYNKLLTLRSHGITQNNDAAYKKGSGYYEMNSLGFNYRLTDFQAALGISQLKKLNLFVKKRRKIVEIYKKGFKNNVFFDLPTEDKNSKSSWHIYVIKLKGKYGNKRRAVFEKLESSGISVRVHFIPIHTQPYYKKTFGYKKGDYPVAEKYYERGLTIPIFPDLKDNDSKKVTDVINDCIK